MHLSFALAVSVATVAAVSAGVYPVKTGADSHTKGVSDDGSSKQHRPQDDDRFHLQSPDGQYVFGLISGNQGKAEMRSKDGTVTGYYSYTGGDGRVVYVNYVADKNGYRVVSNTGVPSASVTIDSGAVDRTAPQAADENFLQIFLDFTERIKGKIVGQIGQKVVDPVGESQFQVPVDPTLNPTKETKPPKHEDGNQFPDWSQIKISTTQKPTDEIKHNEGQQQQEIAVEPNWDSIKITTQKSNEISTEIADSKIEKESTVIDDTENISSATKPVSITNDVQTTISYYDEKSKNYDESNNRGNFQTTISGIKQFEESSTVVTADSETERYQVIKENEKKTENLETDVPTTTRSQDNEPQAKNLPTTEHPSAQTDFQTIGKSSEIDFTTIATKDERVTTMGTLPVHEPKMTTNQPDGGFGDTETTTAAGIQHVTEEYEDRPEFRTLEPTERLGTTVDPNNGQSETQEIIWPEIPQALVPQVLVDPLYPNEEELTLPHAKKAGIKTHPTPTRYNDLEVVEAAAANVNETATITANTTPVNDSENTTLFNFPMFYLTG